MANGLNNAGQVVGYSYVQGDQHYHAFLYDGVMRDMGALCATCDAWATAINESGQVVGTGFNSQGRFRGFIYNGAGLESIEVSGATDTGARDTNNAGEVVGGWTMGDYWNTYLFSGGLVTKLTDIAGEAYGINDRGWITGSGWTSRGFIYDGTFHDIGVLPSDISSYPRAINASGQVVGDSRGESYLSYHPFVYERGTLTPLPGTFGPTIPTALNDYGETVGYVTYGSYASNQAFLFDGTSTVDLNSFLPEGAAWSLQMATGINNRGQIVGQGLINGQERAFLLSPASDVPEPASSQLLIAGFVMVFLAGRSALRSSRR